MPRKIILKTFLSPGDICTLTVAIETLHARYPGEYLTDIRTSCDEIFEHNPHIIKLKDSEGEIIEMLYTTAINHSDTRPRTFVTGYTEYLGRVLGIQLDPIINHPVLYLAEEDYAWIDALKSEFPDGNVKYWVINSGIKMDFTTKQWPVEYFQEVVDHFKGKISFIQVGHPDHNHPNLNNVINMVGRTTHRELIRLCAFGQGGVGPITYIQHLCAAFDKPYMALLGGREPVLWTQYPLQNTFHTLGKLPCCRNRACWKSRVIPLKDGEKSDQSLCEYPMLNFSRPVPKCMTLIKPRDVIQFIEMCYDGGNMAY